MNINFFTKGTTLIVEIKGELDHHNEEYIRRKIDSELTRPSIKNLIFDFTGVSFMDSSGIGIIMGRYKNVSQFNGLVSLVNVNSRLLQIFEMSGVLKFVPAYDNIDDALRVKG